MSSIFLAQHNSFDAVCSLLTVALVVTHLPKYKNKDELKGLALPVQTLGMHHRYGVTQHSVVMSHYVKM